MSSLSRLLRGALKESKGNNSPGLAIFLASIPESEDWLSLHLPDNADNELGA
jgi:hypothetical protein